MRKSPREEFIEQNQRKIERHETLVDVLKILGVILLAAFLVIGFIYEVGKTQACVEDCSKTMKKETCEHMCRWGRR